MQRESVCVRGVQCVCAGGSVCGEEPNVVIVVRDGGCVRRYGWFTTPQACEGGVKSVEMRDGRRGSTTQPCALFRIETQSKTSEGTPHIVIQRTAPTRIHKKRYARSPDADPTAHAQSQGSHPPRTRIALDPIPADRSGCVGRDDDG